MKNELHIFLRRLRGEDKMADIMRQLFREGQCHRLYLIVKTAFPDVGFWEVRHKGLFAHVFIEHRDNFYDIDGRKTDDQINGILNDPDWDLVESTFNKVYLEYSKHETRHLADQSGEKYEFRYPDVPWL